MKTILALFFLMTLFGCGQGPSPKGKVLGYEYFYTGTMEHPIVLSIPALGGMQVTYTLAEADKVTVTDLSTEINENDLLFGGKSVEDMLPDMREHYEKNADMPPESFQPRKMRIFAV